MKTMLQWMLVLFVSALFIGAAPAYAGEATQMWRCEMSDDATEEEVEAMAQTWLNAARKVPGGENLQAYVYFPVAVNATGQMDLMFVVVAPSFSEWGKFWDNYPDSQAAELDGKNQGKVICPDSVLWESKKVK